MLNIEESTFCVELEFTFSDYSQVNLDRINNALSKYCLDDVTVVNHTGMLVKEGELFSRKRYYALKSCTLRCSKAVYGAGLDFRIDTMLADKTVKDCGLLWQENNPDRKLYKKVFRNLEDAYALVVVHHDKTKKKKEREIIPASGQKERERPAAGRHVVNWHDHFENTLPSGICGDGLRYRKEKCVLYIEGQGTIEERAFDEDDSFWKVVIAPGCTGIGDCAFADCNWLQEVILPEGLSRIGECAFYRCSGLEKINIPNTVVEIDYTAFAECVNLNPLKIPSSVAYMRYDTFDHVPEIHYNGLAYHENNWGAEKWICSKAIEVEEIALDYYRENCDMTGQCGENFYYWTAEDILYLEGSGALTDDWDVYSMNDEKEAMGDLRYLVSSKRIVISDGCTAIGDSVFDLDRDLHDFRSNWALPEIFQAISIRIPDGVTEIGKRAFAGCIEVISLVIPETVVKIGEDAFKDVPHIIYHGPAQSDDNWGAKSRN